MCEHIGSSSYVHSVCIICLFRLKSTMSYAVMARKTDNEDYVVDSTGIKKSEMRKTTSILKQLQRNICFFNTICLRPILGSKMGDNSEPQAAVTEYSFLFKKFRSYFCENSLSMTIYSFSDQKGENIMTRFDYTFY